MTNAQPAAVEKEDTGKSVARASGITPWISPRRWRFWVILLFLSYTLGGFFLAPWLLERTVVNRVSELGRTLTIGEVKVNPFLLTLEATDTEFRDTDGELLFSYDDYFWNFQLSSLFRRAWTFKEIRLDGLWLNLERFRAGGNRFGRLVDAFPDETGGDESQDSGDNALPRLIIQDFQLNNGRIALTDDVDGQEFKAEYGPINVDVTNISTLPGESGEHQVSIVTSHGGQISWSGTVQVAEMSSQGHFSIKGKSMEAVHRYLGLHLPFNTGSEATELEFDYKVRKDEEDGLELEIDALSVEANELFATLPDSQEQLIELPRMSIKDASLRWPQKVVTVGSVSISQPRLNLLRSAEGVLNLTELMPGDRAENQELAVQPGENDTGGLSDWTISLGLFGIEDGMLALEDQTIDPSALVGLNGIALEVKTLSNQSGVAFPTQLSLELASGGSLDFGGEVAVIPQLVVRGELSMSGVQMDVVQPWLTRQAHVAIEQGEMSLKGKVSHGPDEPGAYTGSLQITDFGLGDTLRGEELAGWAGMEINRAEVSLASGTVNTSEIELREPYGRLAIARDKTTNLGGLMIKRESDAVSEPVGSEQDPAGLPLSFLVGGVIVKEARLDFSDLSLPLPFAVAIQSLDGTVSTLSSSSVEPARIEMEGQVNDYGSAQISGTINAWDYVDNTDIQMKFLNLEMAELTPYSIQFAGYEIESGRLDLDLDYKVEKGKMLGDNKIIARELTIGDKVESPEAVSLPLKLAVALLKDSNGVIDVDLPVSGDLNDPEFRIGGIVMKAIFNLLTKIVTSPFRLLGSLVGVDSEDFGSLSFKPGDAEVSPPDREKLIKLAEAMAQRPELELTVGGVYAEQVDAAAIKINKVDTELDSRVEQAEQGSDELTTTLRKRAVETLFRERLPGVTLESVQAEHMQADPAAEDSESPAALDETAYVEDLRRRLIESETASQEELLSLAQARAAAVMEVLESAAAEQALSVLKEEVKNVKAEEGQQVTLELSVAVGEK